METKIKVGDIMTRNFISVPPKTKVVDCAKIMAKKNVNSLIIKEGQDLKGIVTESDIIQAVANELDLRNISVDKIMTKRVIGISPNKDLSEAFVLMRRKKIRKLPVIIGKKVIGFLTEKDILKIQPELFEIAVQNMNIAEEKEKLKRIKAIDEYHWVKEGPCQECGSYDILYEVGNKYLCSECKKHKQGVYKE